VVNGVLLAGYVEVGERAFLSGHSTVHQFVRIGRLAMLGGVAGISKDVPPFCTMRPMTVNAVMGLNLVGMRRAGLTAEERLTVQRAFRILYRSGLNTGQALERIGREFTPGSLAGEMAAFIAASKRGICSLDAGADSGAGEQDEKRQAGTAKAVENERDAKE
jgi:UDP-N-acetylglucosamine acyltransferase